MQFYEAVTCRKLQMRSFYWFLLIFSRHNIFQTHSTSFFQRSRIYWAMCSYDILFCVILYLTSFLRVISSVDNILIRAQCESQCIEKVEDLSEIILVKTQNNLNVFPCSTVFSIGQALENHSNVLIHVKM